VKKISTIGYLVGAIGLFLYSFTQVDLDLTLSRWSVWQVIEKYFQHIGYFQRPLSSCLFTGIILLLFFFYLMILKSIKKRKMEKKELWSLIILVTVILVFSYNAFSYDLFNYIFDARIVTHYFQNPYLHKALDYSGDPMLSFMHWTHRLYPYGPIWIGLTIPLSFIGLQFFLPTFFLFKIFIAACFLGTVYFIGKILQKTSVKDQLFGIAFFALNPLVIVESLVSAHNDIVMMFFGVWALYALMNMRYVRSIILFALSVGVKFATAAIFPVYALIIYLQKKNKRINWQLMFVFMAIFMIVPIIFASFRTSFQPWYLLNVFPFVALVSTDYYAFIPGVVVSLFAVFEYLPFLYTGNWDNPIPLILFWMTTCSIILSLLFTAGWYTKKMVK
jgi:hypothetical protein